MYKVTYKTKDGELEEALLTLDLVQHLLNRATTWGITEITIKPLIWKVA